MLGADEDLFGEQIVESLSDFVVIEAMGFPRENAAALPDAPSDCGMRIKQRFSFCFPATACKYLLRTAASGPKNVV